MVYKLNNHQEVLRRTERKRFEDYEEYTMKKTDDELYDHQMEPRMVFRLVIKNIIS